MSCNSPPLRQKQQNDSGKYGEQRPQADVGQHSPPRYVETVEQRGQRRAEKPVAEEIGGKVQQYGSIGIREPDP